MNIICKLFSIFVLDMFVVDHVYLPLHPLGPSSSNVATFVAFLKLAILAPGRLPKSKPASTIFASRLVGKCGSVVRHISYTCRRLSQPRTPPKSRI